MWRSLIRAGAVVSIGVFLGRILGLLRELVLAHRLGGGPSADVAVYALTLPDLFTNLLVGGLVSGAVAAALVPEFLSFPGRSRALLWQATGVTLAVFGALAGAAALAGPLLQRLLAPGFSAPLAASALEVATRALGAIPLVAAAAVSNAFLQSRNRFAVPSLGNVLSNAGVVVTLYFWVTPERLTPLGWGILAAAGLRWIVQLLQAAAIADAPPTPPGWTITRTLLKRYAETLGSFGLMALVPVAARALASTQGSGAIASLNFAQKIVELPLGLAVGLLGAVLLPRFSEFHARGAAEEARVLGQQGLWLSWLLSIPALLGLAWFSEPVARLFFGHGAMSAEAASRVGTLAAWSLLGMPAQGFSVILFAMLAARKDSSRPFRWGLILFALYLPAAWASQRLFGLEGLLLAGVLSQWMLVIIYLVLLRRHHGLVMVQAPLLRDLAVALAGAAAGFAPVALAVARSAAPIPGSVAALIGGSAAFGLCLALPYRTIPGGWRLLLSRGRSRGTADPAGNGGRENRIPGQEDSGGSAK